MYNRVTISCFCLLFLAFGRLEAQNTTPEVKQLLKQARVNLNAQPDSCVYYSQAAYKKASDQKNHWAMVKSLTYIGRVREKQKQPEQAIQHYFDALDLMTRSDTLDDFNTATLNRNIAGIQKNHNNHKQAVAYYDSALFYLHRHVREYPDIARKDGDYRHIYSIEYNKAQSQRRLGDIEAAQSSFLSLLRDTQTPWRVQVNSLYQIGLMFNELQEPDSAQKYFRLGIEHEKADSLRISRGYHNLAMVYFQQGDYTAALDLYMQAIRLKERLKDKKSLFISLIDLGESYLMLGQYSQANEVFEKATRTLGEETIKTDPKYYNLYQLQSQVFASTNPEASRQMIRKYVNCTREFQRLQEVLRDEGRRRAFNLAMSNYWAEKEHVQEVQTLDRKYTAWIWVIIIGFSIAFYMGFQVLRVYRRKKLFREINKVTRDRTIRAS